MISRFQCTQGFTEFSIVQDFIIFVDNRIIFRQSATFILDVFHRSLTWNKSINRRSDKTGSQASVNVFRSKSSVKLYSSSVERNYTCLIPIPSFDRISCFREWFLFSLNLAMLSNDSSFLE